MITWKIIDRCNFNCAYCFQWQKNKQKLNPIDLAKLSESLSYLKKDWLFHISGGEPFLENKFIDICSEITKNHYISLSTNLSTTNVYDFANKINPERTLFINAAVHVAEREKRDDNLSSFIEKILYLQKKGFNVIAYYVAHPILLNRIKSDIEYLKSKEIQNLSIKIFRGIYNGIYYPLSFTSGEIEFLKSMESIYPELEILKGSQAYYGRSCLAGQRFFTMDREGNLRRCSSLYRNYGNLFDKTMKFDTDARPCPIKKCGCPYEGIRNVVASKNNIKMVLQEDIFEKSLKLIRVVSNPKLLKKLNEKRLEYFPQLTQFL